MTSSVDYVFKLPKPYEIVQKRNEQEEQMYDRINSRLNRGGMKRGGNRYARIMSPLITPQSHITQLRKQQEALAHARATQSQSSNTSVPMAASMAGLLGIPGASSSSASTASASASQSAEAVNKQISELVRSPMLKGRVALRLALTKTTPATPKPSAFAAANTEKKEVPVPTTLPPTLDLHQRAKKEEKQGGKAGEGKAALYKQIASMKRKLMMLDDATLSSVHQNTIEEQNEVEVEVEEPTSHKESKAEVIAEPVKKPILTVLHNLRMQNGNRQLLKYVSNRLLQAKATPGPVSAQHARAISSASTLASSLPSSKHHRESLWSAFAGAMQNSQGVAAESQKLRIRNQAALFTTATSIHHHKRLSKAERNKMPKSSSFARGIYAALGLRA